MMLVEPKANDVLDGRPKDAPTSRILERTMKQPLIDYRDLIQSYDLDHHRKSANAYFAQIGPRHPVMRKPFASTAEAIEITAGISVILDAIKPFPGSKILDFGCGGGWLSDILAMLGSDAYGIDLAETAVAVAQATFSSDQRHHAGKTNFRVFDGETIPFEEESFDAIVCFDAFHHVHNPEKIIHEFFRVLKPGGIVAFHEPGPHHSTFPQSQMEMRSFGVIESDLVIEDIDQYAKKVGFKSPQLAISIPHPYWTDMAGFNSIVGQKNLLKGWRSKIRNAILSFLFPKTLLNHVQRNFINLRMFSLQKPGAIVVDSRSGHGLKCDIILLRVKRRDQFLDVSLQIANIGQATWLRSGDRVGNVNIAFKTYNKDHVQISDIRVHAFDRDMKAGEKHTIECSIAIKDETEMMLVDLVSEHVCWFETLSNKPLYLAIDSIG